MGIRFGTHCLLHLNANKNNFFFHQKIKQRRWCMWWTLQWQRFISQIVPMEIYWFFFHRIASKNCFLLHSISNIVWYLKKTANSFPLNEFVFKNSSLNSILTYSQISCFLNWNNWMSFTTNRKREKKIMIFVYLPTLWQVIR